MSTGAPPADRPGVAPKSLALRLREETRAAHESVERAASFNRLVVVRLPDAGGDPRQGVSDPAALAGEYREVYRRFLVAALGFEAAVNARIAASPARDAALRSGYAPERSDPVALIRDDLVQVFGPEVRIEATLMDGLPPVRTLAELAGVEYVRRGSRAGGAVIAAVVERNLGLTRERGASFLAQYGRQTRALIVGLREWLDALPFSESDAIECVATARATFAAIERWHLELEGAFERG